MKYLLFYHGDVDYVNASHCYLLRTLPVLPARCKRINTAVTAPHCCTCFFSWIVCTRVSVIPADEIRSLVAMNGSVLCSARLVPPYLRDRHHHIPAVTVSSNMSHLCSYQEIYCIRGPKRIFFQPYRWWWWWWWWRRHKWGCRYKQLWQ